MRIPRGACPHWLIRTPLSTLVTSDRVKQWCIHVIDTVASWQQILQFTIDISCLVNNGAKMVLKGLSRHPQLTVSITWTQYWTLDSRNGTSSFQSLIMSQSHIEGKAKFR